MYNPLNGFFNILVHELTQFCVCVCEYMQEGEVTLTVVVKCRFGGGLL